MKEGGYMGIRVGIPFLKLKFNGTKSKRSGNALAIAQEMLEERYTQDEDIDRTKSHLNTYTGFTTGRELHEYWELEASKHLDALGRPLRSDAIIGYSAILKPDKESMESMTEEEQERFIADGTRVLCNLLTEHGLQIDATAVQRDEQVLHTHIAGHDVDYQAARKINLKLFRSFNREFPKRMREFGYDVEDLVVYDVEKVASMTEEQQKAYKKEHIAEKKAKKHGQSSSLYKQQKIDEQKKALQKEQQKLNTEKQQLKDRMTKQLKDKQKLHDKEKNLIEQEKDLAMKEVFVEQQRKENEELIEMGKKYKALQEQKKKERLQYLDRQYGHIGANRQNSTSSQFGK